MLKLLLIGLILCSLRVYSYADVTPGVPDTSNFLEKTGGSMTGTLDMTNNSITGVYSIQWPDGTQTSSPTAGGADNLGNHTATQQLDMGATDIIKLNAAYFGSTYGGPLSGVYMFYDNLNYMLPISTTISVNGMVESTNFRDSDGAFLADMNYDSTNYKWMCSTSVDVSGDLSLDGAVLFDYTADPDYKVTIDTLTDVSGLSVNAAYTFPTADGGNQEYLQTDGAGTVSWASVAPANKNRILRLHPGGAGINTHANYAIPYNEQFEVGSSTVPVWDVRFLETGRTQICYTYVIDPEWDATNMTLYIRWASTAASNGNVVFISSATAVKMGVEETYRQTDNYEIDYSTPVSASSTAYAICYSTITLNNYNQAVDAGAWVTHIIERDTDYGTDTNTGRAEVLYMYVDYDVN